MSEYIKREALSDFILGLTIVDPMVAQYADAVLMHIQQAPAADVAPVRRGHWILVDKSYAEYECSVCHARDSDCSDCYGTHIVLEQKHCPHCGAKMILGDKA